MSEFINFSNLGSKSNNDGPLDEMTTSFLRELDNQILSLESSTIELESNPDNMDQINATFRLFHNLKGSAAMMSFGNLVDLAHYAENLLQLARINRLRFQTKHVDLLLETLTAIKEIGYTIRKSGKEGAERYFLILQQLVDYSREAEDVAVAENSDPSDPSKGPAKKASNEQKDSGDNLIKVSRKLIDQMMLLAGEFMLLKNRVHWLREKYPKDSDFSDKCEELEHFSSNLQRSLLRMRLSPVGPLFASMKRIVRTTAKQVDKQINFELEGDETLLDRTIMEALHDPLMHMIRNAVDHGIEDAATRRSRNKPEAGNVELRAIYISGEVHIIISDDGGGIDGEKLKLKAIDKGLITEAQAKQMSKQESYQIIFLPGFSSAETITETSGRGVGMDVVKRAIEGVGGEIEIQTDLGSGTNFTIRLPLSLAIVECLAFKVGDQTYALPQVNIEEVVSADAEVIRENLRTVNGHGKVLIVRNEPLPVLQLSEILELPTAKLNALIQLRQGRFRFVIETGQIIGPVSIVSQPLPPVFADDAPFSGVTKQGDGSLLFQLDVTKLFKHVKKKALNRKKKTAYNRGVAGNRQEDTLLTISEIKRLQQKILTFQNYQHFCIPVQRVRRIVFIHKEEIIFIGEDGHSYVTLEGQTIPLIWVEELVLHRTKIQAETYSLLIFTEGGFDAAIPIHHFLGIQRMPEYYDSNIAQFGVLGSTVIDNDSYLLLDLPALVRKYRNVKEELDVNKKRILIAEDDKFFASEIVSSLASHDVELVLKEDGAQAKEALEDSLETGLFDMIVTDIEMPVMTGLALIRWARSQPQFVNIPILAYTAISTEEMKSKVLNAGANEFISKMSLNSLSDKARGHMSGKSNLNEDSGDDKSSVSRVMTFCMGDFWFAFPMKHIKEVSPITPSAPIPKSHRSMPRVTSFRGVMIPVLDLRILFGLERHETREPKEQAILDVEGTYFAILVDKIGEVIIESKMSLGDGLPMNSEQDKKIAEYTSNVYKYRDQIVVLINTTLIAELTNLKESEDKAA